MKVCLHCGGQSPATPLSCAQCGFSPGEVDGIPTLAPDVAAGATFGQPCFAELLDVDEWHFWFRVRSRLVVDALRRHFPEARSLLEIGCGTGGFLEVVRRSMPGIALWGGDMVIDAARLAARRVPGARLMQLDARRMPFVDEFDVICALDILEHVPEDELVLNQLAQAARPGGGMVLTVPQHRGLWSVVDEYAGHQRRYSRRELVEKVERAGFDVLQVTSFVSLLLPLMWLRRILAPRLRDRFDPMAEFRIPRWLNTALAGLLNVDRRLVGRGVSLPAGGSLLLVARRTTGGVG